MKRTKVKKSRPREADALEYLKKGHFLIKLSDYATPEERREKLEQLEQEAIVLIKKHISRTRNISFLILKGHILIEYMMTQYIEIMSHYSIDIEKERFSYTQKIAIMHMMGFPYSPAFYPCLDILNTLRNQVGHKLDIDHKLIDKMLRLEINRDELPSKLSDKERLMFLRQWIKSAIYKILYTTYAFEVVATG